MVRLTIITIFWMFFLKEAYKKLRKKIIGTEFFMVIATVFALASGQEQALIIIFSMLFIVHLIEQYIERATQASLQKLLNLVPDTALIVEDGVEKMIATPALVPGMTVLVKTGMKIPVDGIVTQGKGMINESSLTGESLLQGKALSSRVYAGTFVESGTLLLCVEKVNKDTVFGKIGELLRQAELTKAPIVSLTNRIATLFTPLVLMLIGVIWLITNNSNLVTTLLVFGSPLELSLITPLTLVCGSIAAFKNGVLVKNSRALERMASVDTIIFDKTGTLTLGKPQLLETIVVDNNCSPDTIIYLCAIAQRYAHAPFSHEIIAQAEKMRGPVPYPESYESLAGHGIKMEYNGQIYWVGNRHYIEDADHAHIPFPPSLAICKSETLVFLAAQDRLLGYLVLADTIRPEAQQIIDHLRKTGIKKTIIASGDKSGVVEKIAFSVGATQAYGELFPEQKLALLQDLQKNGHSVVMVGDGINDVLALKRADVGIALGGLRIEPALEAAQIVLMTDNLAQILFIRKLSQKIMNTIYQNLMIGFVCVHVGGFAIACTGLVTPVQATLFHAITDVLILLNSARLSFFRL